MGEMGRFVLVLTLLMMLSGCRYYPLCEAMSPDGRHRVVVTKTREVIDERIRVRLDGMGWSEVILDDRRDRKPTGCGIRWREDSSQVRIWVTDIHAGDVHIAYDVLQQRWLTERERLLIDLPAKP